MKSNEGKFLYEGEDCKMTKLFTNKTGYFVSHEFCLNINHFTTKIFMNAFTWMRMKLVFIFKRIWNIFYFFVFCFYKYHFEAIYSWTTLSVVIKMCAVWINLYEIAEKISIYALFTLEAKSRKSLFDEIMIYQFDHKKCKNFSIQN